MTEWRLEAYRRWLTMEEPTWQKPHYPPIDYQAISYYSAPKQKERPKSLDEVDPEIRKTYDKLGIPIREQEILAGVAVDYVFDSVSVATTFRAKLAELGVDLLLDLRGDPRASRAGAPLSGLGRAAGRQLLRRAEFGRLLRRQLRLRAQGRALPDGAVHLFPHQRRRHRPVRAHADHRRRGRLRQLPRRLHGAACATRTSCTRPWSSW